MVFCIGAWLWGPDGFRVRLDSAGYWSTGLVPGSVSQPMLSGYVYLSNVLVPI